jgi:hypothetical protein
MKSKSLLGINMCKWIYLFIYLEMYLYIYKCEHTYVYGIINYYS